MLYIILVFTYLIGMSDIFYRAMELDESTMREHGHLGKFHGFTSYLILCALWPVTMWVQMYFRWLQVRDISKE